MQEPFAEGAMNMIGPTPVSPITLHASLAQFVSSYTLKQTHITNFQDETKGSSKVCCLTKMFWAQFANLLLTRETKTIPALPGIYKFQSVIIPYLR